MRNLILICFAIIITNSLAAQTLSPGDIHPNAKYIDADRLDEFSKGRALVKKGNRVGLINADGSFAVPLGKYSFIRLLRSKDALGSSTDRVYPSSGIYLAENSEILLPGGKVNKLLTGVDKIAPNNEYLYGSHNNALENTVLHIESGTKSVIPFSAFMSQYGAGLIPFNSRTNSRFGFMDVKGKVIVGQQFQTVWPFYDDSLAKVIVTGPDGSQKFGFINTKGELAIPAKYSVAPSDFYNGTAIVFTVNNPEFSMALINTKGEIIKKYNKYEVINLNPNYGFKMINGVRIFKDHVIMADGKMVKKSDFLGLYGITPKYERESLTLSDHEDEGRIYFKRQFVKNKRPAHSTGIYDLKTKKIIETPFTSPLKFDPVSGLAHAIVADGLTGKTIEGYVNQEGIFMLVKQPPSGW